MDVLKVCIFACVLMLLYSCKPQQVIVTSDIRTEHIQKTVPVVLPVETASAQAVLECNAEGMVLLSKLNVETSRNARLNLMLDSIGNLLVDAVLGRDTIYLKADSITVTKNIVRTEIEYRDRPLSKWKSFLLDFGNIIFWIAAGLTIGGLVLLFLKWKK
ncbi:MAG: hypothetical protein LBV74_20995 [Tannerella sp.]|jgi:hypothetical protein|nr:hypothetical protein [Tannerella sp.]